MRDPERYGVVSFDSNFNALTIEEKPQHPKSNFAVPGMYFFDNQVSEIASQPKPSPRGELEITDIIRTYLAAGKLTVRVLGRGIAWLDAGTYESLLQASSFVQAVQERQGLMICCPEEITFQQGFIGRDQLQKMAEQLRHKCYGDYLLRLLADTDQ